MEEDHIAFRVFKILASIILGMLVCMCIFFIVVFNDGDPGSYLSPKRISNESGHNLFNPETILLAIRNNETDVFSETDLYPVLPPPEDYINTVNFTEDEFYEIARYYLRTKWNEDPDDWRLTRIVYSIDYCDKGFDGPFSVGYGFQKIVEIDGERYRDDRSIRIDMWSDMIVWSDKVDDRDYLSSEINWQRIKVNAFEAYQIAEENGGREYYIEPDNQCRAISIKMYGNNRYWNVYYWSEEISVDSLFLEINRRTGVVRRK